MPISRFIRLLLAALFLSGLLAASFANAQAAESLPHPRNLL